MRRGTLFIISLIVGIFLLTACGKNGPSKDAVLDPDIFGTWKQITEDGSASLEDIGIPSGYVFNEDGTGEDHYPNKAEITTGTLLSRAMFSLLSSSGDMKCATS